jgi:hypothetical protein
LALFAVLFGTRHADATEHQNGLVLAVASRVRWSSWRRSSRSGLIVTFMLFGGPGDLFAQAFGNRASVEQGDMSYSAPRSGHGWSMTSDQRLRHSSCCRASST